MDKTWCMSALSLMLKSRYFEDKTEELFKSGLIHGTTHLANGQEASQVGLCMALNKNDWIVPTHRCHGFTTAKGSSPYSMFSEMFGSANGLAKGLGGSMHMPDKEHCNLGSSAVVGSGVPLATGIGFYFKRKKINNLSVAIFGDGASSRGSIHESMNLASVWKLPVLFYCENNLYGMSASCSDMVSTERISKRAESYSMPGCTVDGNDVVAVYDAVLKACEYIRSGNGPYMLEVLTYRQKGHSKSDRRLYRTQEEEQFWLKKDPILLFENKLIAENIFTESEIENLKRDVFTEISDSATKALQDAGIKLSSEQALGLVYAEQWER